MVERRIMGMPVRVHGADGDAAAVFEWLRWVDATFSTYRADSEVCRLDRGELALRDAHPLVREVLERCEALREPTGGYFDARAGGRLDPSGLVKGWAVDRAAVALQDLPGVSFCINAGGDLVVGAHPDLPDDGPGAIAWRIGIEDPRDRSRTAHVVSLTRGAVATSGTAARGAHLYDPASGELVGRAGSTTVHGPTLLWADVWATALFVGDETTRAAFASRAPAYASIDQ